MRDSDPRPMPHDVTRAYRDPMKFERLFPTSVFTESDCISVRDELLRRLVTKHGNAEIESRSKIETVSERIARSDRRPWDSIELMMYVPEYGGIEEVEADLSHVMQSYWGVWWNSFRWASWDEVFRWEDAAVTVLGDRQLRWLTAQYARAVIGMVGSRDVRVCLEAIETAEAYAADPSFVNLNRMKAARDAVTSSCAEADVFAYQHAAAYTAYYASDVAYGSAGVSGSVDIGAAVASAVGGSGASYAEHRTAYTHFAELTKQLITPTLITRACRGL